MTQMDIQLSNFNINRIRIFTALASLLLSLQAVYFDDILNRDGIMYLQMVEAYLAGGLIAARTIFDWPAFSILVAWIHQITPFSIETNAFITNSLLFLLLTDALVLISSIIVSSQRQLLIASILILCFMPINEYRDFIIRDVGYWAFCSLALYQFMKYMQTSSFSRATLWQAFMIIAILFRIEGTVIFLALPLFLLFNQPFTIAFKQLIQTYYLLLISSFIIILFVLTQADIVSAFSKLASIPSTYLNLNKYSEKLITSSEIIETQILNKYSADYAPLMVISGLLTMLVYKILKLFSASYIIIYLTTLNKKSTSHFPLYQKLLFYFFALNILILTIFLFKQYFISGRYTILALIGLLLLVIPRLCQNIERFWLNKDLWPLTLIGLALFYSVADTATLSNSKTYIKDTALWAAHNLPSGSRVITDDEFTFYYFDRESTAVSLCVKPIFRPNDFTAEHASINPYPSGFCSEEKATDYRNYDYVLVVEKKRHPELRAFLKTLSIKRIYYLENDRLEDGASVYQVIK
jgi:hypothetical protein